jgi:hypothetical protein
MNVSLVQALLAQTQTWRWDVEASAAESFAAAAG